MPAQQSLSFAYCRHMQALGATAPDPTPQQSSCPECCRCRCCHSTRGGVSISKRASCMRMVLCTDACGKNVQGLADSLDVFSNDEQLQRSCAACQQARPACAIDGALSWASSSLMKTKHTGVLLTAIRSPCWVAVCRVSAHA